jgi:hypothetical protein
MTYETTILTATEEFAKANNIPYDEQTESMILNAIRETVRVTKFDKKHYTAILEFEIIKPIDDDEKQNEPLILTYSGEYRPVCSMRGYPLLYLLDNPDHYRVSKIMMRGISYVIPGDREKNYAQNLRSGIQGNLQNQFYTNTYKNDNSNRF